MQLEDREDVFWLTQQEHAASAFSSMPLGQHKFDLIFDKIVNREAIGLLARIGREPAGFIYVTIGKYFLSDADPIATVNALYVSTKARHGLIGGKIAISLIRSAQSIAQDQQATHLLFHVTSGINIMKTDRFFRKLGATTLGGNYLFKIQCYCSVNAPLKPRVIGLIK